MRRSTRLFQELHLLAMRDLVEGLFIRFENVECIARMGPPIARQHPPLVCDVGGDPQGECPRFADDPVVLHPQQPQVHFLRQIVGVLGIDESARNQPDQPPTALSGQFGKPVRLTFIQPLHL